MRPSLLIVDDEQAICLSVSTYFMRRGFDVRAAQSLHGGREAVQTDPPKAVFLDLSLPDGNGLDWIDELRAGHPGMAIVVITGSGEISTAVEAMQKGADHYVTKPCNFAELEVFLRKSLEIGQLRRRLELHKRQSREVEPFFGTAPAWRSVRNLAAIAASSQAAILLTGETGTGKGVLARWIHAHGARSSMPFVEVNCSVLRGELLASELFGHARGAFTSATDSRSGLLDAADGGSLFLDEIGDMDPAIQAQFLNVIEEKRYRRLGETSMRQSDFRLLCATNHDLDADVAIGRFRSDLFFRINVLPLRLPSLRSVPEDFDRLLAHLVASMDLGIDGIDAEARAQLRAYAWPGNVRELRNVLERASLLARGNGPLRVEHFPALVVPARPSRKPGSVAAPELDRLAAVLARCDGDKQRAARELGISRATLYRRLQQKG